MSIPEDSPFPGPDATRADCEIRGQASFGRTERPCDVASRPKKRKVDFNPLERRWLQEHGYVFERVEQPTAFGARTRDLFGVFDYIAARPEQPGTLYIQVTDPTHRAARRKKVLAAPETAVLLAAGNQVELHIWEQPAGPGTRWALKVEEIAPTPASEPHSPGSGDFGEGDVNR